MVFQKRTDFGKPDGPYLVHEDHQMRVSHGYGYPLRIPVPLPQIHGSDTGGNSHIYRHRFNHPLIIYPEIQDLDARTGLQGYPGLLCQTVFVHIFSDATGSISTHHGFRPVGIENPHAEVSFLRRTDQYQSVTTDSGVRTAPFL